MSRPLRIETVHVARLPGIDEPFSLTDCSPGLNLVFGPNASGKSSLVRAMEVVLWPEAAASRACTVSATCTSGDDTWRVELDAGLVRVTRNGVDSAPPAWPSPELRHRYCLSLHDLLALADDRDFASAILRASAGGLDLNAAEASVGFTDRVFGVRAARNAWDEANTALAAAQRQQAALHQETAQLAQLEQAAEAAGRAHHSALALRAAIAWHQARAALAKASAERAALPTAVARLDGTELDRAQALHERWTHACGELVACDIRLTQANAAIRAGFAHATPTAMDRDAWRAALDTLRETDASHARARVRSAEAVARSDAARQPLGDAFHNEPTIAITPSRVEELASFARREARWHTAWLQVTQELERLEERMLDERTRDGIRGTTREGTGEGTGEDAPDPDAERDAQRDSLRLLTRWLAADASRSRRADVTRRLAMWCGIVGSAGWLALAAGVNADAPVAGASVFIGAVVSVLLLAGTWWATRRPPSPSDDRPRLEHELRTLGVAIPDAFTRDAVITALDQCTRELVAVARRAEGVERSRELEVRRQRLDAERQLLEAERAELLRTVGLASSTDTQTLPWLLDRVARWQDAELEIAAAAAAAGVTGAAHTTALHAMHARCAPFAGHAGALRVEHVADAEAIVSTLDDRYEAHREALRDAAEAERLRARQQEDARRIAEEWDALRKHVDLEAPAFAIDRAHEPVSGHAMHQFERALEARLAQRIDHDRLSRAMADASRDMMHAERSCPDEDTSHWSASSPTQLAERLEQAEQSAARHTELVRRVATLRERVDRATRGHDVEAALAAVDAAADAVHAQFLQNVDAMVGHALLRHVQEASRDVDRPPVFHRARELFGRITRGAWQLELVESTGDEPAFHAIDTRTQRMVPLDALSSGTRVQLLVAVRIAFVESEESTWMLPLFLDETLGNSDDARAGALIDAVLSLVAEGRQVFYLTAQHDEVAHWRAMLARHALPWREVDVAALRRLPPDVGAHRAQPVETEPLRAPSATVGAVDVPTVGEHTHESYRRLLSVPAVRPGQTPLSETHPWYLIESLPVLHAVLSLGIDAWGPLTFYRQLGAPLLVESVSADVVRRALQHADHLARALGALHELAAVGHGRPVTRQVLLDSECVSSQWLDDIARLALECDGDARALLAFLEHPGVKGFGQQRISTLRERLTASMHLDVRTPHTAAELRVGMLAAVGAAASPRDLDALLQRVARSATK